MYYVLVKKKSLYIYKSINYKVSNVSNYLPILVFYMFMIYHFALSI